MPQLFAVYCEYDSDWRNSAQSNYDLQSFSWFRQYDKKGVVITPLETYDLIDWLLVEKMNIYDIIVFYIGYLRCRIIKKIKSDQFENKISLY